MWTRRGIVFSSERAQLPVVSLLDGKYFMTFSSRDEEGCSYGKITSFSLDENHTPIFINKEHPFLFRGKAGDCDVSGSMPMQVVGGLLYYIGWTLRKDVPYFNYTCLASFSEGEEVVKMGPILAPDIIDQGYSGTLNVFQPKNKTLNFGYYLSGTGWIEDETGALQPSYDIKIATSIDLISWKKLGKTAILQRKDEAGISAASVVEYENVYHMWFSVRKGMYFRNGDGVYAIEHAYSYDAITWIRTKKFGIKASEALGENMAAYPTVFIDDQKIHLFYNGHSFGLKGVSQAIMNASLLNKSLKG